MTGARRAALSAVVALALVVSSLGVPAALAAPNAAAREARRHFDEAELSYRAGHYAEALAKYQAGYAAAPLPGFLVNIAQCQRRLGDLKTARATYREFVLVAPDSRLVPEVETLIKELDTLIADLASGGSGETAAQEGAGAGNADVHMTDPAAPPPSPAPAAPSLSLAASAPTETHGAHRHPGAARRGDTAAALACPLVDLGRCRGRGRRRAAWRRELRCRHRAPRRFARGRWGRSAARTDDDAIHLRPTDNGSPGGGRRGGGLPQLEAGSRGGRATSWRSGSRRAPRRPTRFGCSSTTTPAPCGATCGFPRKDRWSPRARRSSERSSFNRARRSVICGSTCAGSRPAPWSRKGTLRIPAASATGGTFDVTLAAALPTDSDGDGVPDPLDDCPSVPDPKQTGCSTDSGVTDAAIGRRDAAVDAPQDASPVRPDAGRMDAGRVDAGRVDAAGWTRGATSPARRRAPLAARPANARAGSARMASAATAPAPTRATAARPAPAPRSRTPPTIRSASPPCPATTKGSASPLGN